MAFNAGNAGRWAGRHKCLIFVVFFVVEISFLDHNSLLCRNRTNRERAVLAAELERYRQSCENDTRELHALETDSRAVERIARERYFMKAADEDVYVVEYSDGDASDKSYNDGQTQ